MQCTLLNDIRGYMGTIIGIRFSSSSSPQPAKAGSTFSQPWLPKLSPTYFQEPLIRHNHFHQELCLSPFYRLQNRGLKKQLHKWCRESWHCTGNKWKQSQSGLPLHPALLSCSMSLPPTFSSPGHSDPETFVLFPENDWVPIIRTRESMTSTASCFPLCLPGR